MRRILVRLGRVGVLLAAGGCTAELTAPRAATDGASGYSEWATITCVRTEQGCPIPGIVVIGHPNEPKCDPWSDPSWCQGGYECIEAAGFPGFPEFVGLASCPPGGYPPPPPPGGGGGGTPTVPRPELEQPDTACNTGDPVIESQAIQTVLHDLWRRSNPTASAHSQRVEQGGWIVSDGAGGFRFEEFPANWLRTPCSIIFPQVFTPPAGVVAWVHTHPYANGDRQTECQQEPVKGGVLVPFKYTGNPSVGDDAMTRAIRQGGYPHLIGYMIDANHIVRSTGDNTPGGVRPLPRCGY